MNDFIENNYILIIIFLIIVICVLIYFLLKKGKKEYRKPKNYLKKKQNQKEKIEKINKIESSLKFTPPKSVKEWININKDWQCPKPESLDDWKYLIEYFLGDNINSKTFSLYDGLYFEYVFIPEILKFFGFNVRFNGNKKDHGIDLIAEHPLCGGIPIIIQCKCYSNKVYTTDVQYFNGIRDSVLINHTNVIMLFITNNYFFDNENMNYPNINFINGNILKSMCKLLCYSLSKKTLTEDISIIIKLTTYLSDIPDKVDKIKQGNKVIAKVNNSNGEPIFEFYVIENNTEWLLGKELHKDNEYIVDNNSKEIISVLKIFYKMFCKAYSKFNINKMFSFEYVSHYDNSYSGYTLELGVRLSVESGNVLDSSKFNNLYQVSDTSI